ncbi:helix-turn-helix domain-containing protein [Variovorax sp. tm]|uniref:helix-turn-helix domain-containing protein n=1 Tax=Variovorax atrisoli TaxID=3394203 RepID=UPI003A80B0CB
MPNIASILKEEISRLARREIRVELDALRKAVTQQRTLIAALRRQVQELERAQRRLGKQNSSKPEEPVVAEVRTLRRFSPSRLAGHRTKLGLSAADYGQLVGVSGQTIYHWEQGKARPRATQLQALVAVRAMGKREVQQRLEQG